MMVDLAFGLNYSFNLLKKQNFKRGQKEEFRPEDVAVGTIMKQHGKEGHEKSE